MIKYNEHFRAIVKESHCRRYTTLVRWEMIAIIKSKKKSEIWQNSIYIYSKSGAAWERAGYGDINAYTEHWYSVTFTIISYRYTYIWNGWWNTPSPHNRPWWTHRLSLLIWSSACSAWKMVATTWIEKRLQLKQWFAP